MLLKICLIVAILAGGGVVAVNFLKVKPAIETIRDARDSEQKQKVATQKTLDKTKKDLKDTSDKLDTTSKDLESTRTKLTAANRQVSTLQSQTNTLHEELGKAMDARDKAQGELAEWHQLHMTPDQVVKATNDLKKVTRDFMGASQEALVLKTEVDKLTNELWALRPNTSDVVELPTGLKGKVVAVDPKYDFVILNIGEDKGVLPKGIMMVHRDGKLIGKVQIVTVKNNQSVANILPAWRRGEVMEGDEVLY
jgi:predicted  nucleic acid-binding Zn-ribbon protein